MTRAALTLLVQNALLQLELRRKLGIPLVYRPAVEAYGVIAATTAILWLVVSMSGPWVGIGLVLVASLAVFVLTQRALRMDDMFPEIRELALAVREAVARPIRRLGSRLDPEPSTGLRAAWRRLRRFR